jgi:hypothetical protein
MRLDVDWLRTGDLARILALLDSGGEEARVVGGAVRNALLHEPLGDIDIATTARPEEVVRRVEAAGCKAVPTGIEHGTITVVADGQPFEVTTLREDVETDGRRAKVVFGRDWRRDAERRDFTMNALFLARDGTVHDHAGGLADIADLACVYRRCSHASPTICASCASSAFTPPTAMAGCRMPPASTPALWRVLADTPRASVCAWNAR